MTGHSVRAQGSPASRRAGLTGARVAGWWRAAALLAGLAAVVTGRWLATRAGIDPLWIGAAFGVALAVVWRSGLEPRGDMEGRRQRSVTVLAIGVAAGIAAGLALVAITIVAAEVGAGPAAPGFGRPAAPFAAWAVVTIVVATAEEGLLRGALFDSTRAAGGVMAAVVVTSVAFALLHVPLYGWAVVPLDVAVGVAFAGLRLATGTVVAPAIAHAAADLATWWL